MELRGRWNSCVPSALEVEIQKAAVQLSVAVCERGARRFSKILIWCGIGSILLLCLLAVWVLALKGFGMSPP